jgi:hypothetical protein
MSELRALPNPFRDTVVQDAWQHPVDISEIHAAAFDACLAGIDSAAHGVPDSLLIYGAAGSGKTHLLARLQRHLAETARNAPDSVLRCVFCFVRLQTSPALLWQHVRRRLATDLMRREQGLTQLQRLVGHQLGIGWGRTARAGILELRVLRAEDEAALTQHLRDLGMKLDLPRNLCMVLEQLVFDRNVRDASAWLAGEGLPDSVLQTLGLGPESDEDPEEVARHISTALCRLAGETLPIVFCFDQVESLQRTATDEEALFRFGRMAADLHDADPNVFLITCLQATFVDHFKKAVRTADLDRIARRSALLEPLTEAQVGRLVELRLASASGLRSLRAEHPAEQFYPLKPNIVRKLALEPASTPRRVLSLAARAFEECQHGKVPEAPPTEQFLNQELEERRESLTGKLEPSNTQRIVIQGAELIAQVEGASVDANDQEKADLVVTGPSRTALHVRNEVDGRSLTPKLKALLAHTPRRDGASVLIVRDSRIPIAKTAVKAREHLATLQERGVRVIEPSIEALTALEALSSILADAKSGDLANQDSTLDAGAVLTWLRSLRDDPALSPVQELVTAMFDGKGLVTRNEEQDLADLLSHERAIAADLAAQILGQKLERVLEVARKARRHCLVLEGPPAVLLDVAGVAPEMEAAS